MSRAGQATRSLEAWLGGALRTVSAARRVALLAGGAGSVPQSGRAIRLRQALPTLLDELLGGMDRERVTRRARLASMQIARGAEISPPSQAVGFLFQLKDDSARRAAPAPTWTLLTERIDEMALLAFDLYVKYREQDCRKRGPTRRRGAYSCWNALGATVESESAGGEAHDERARTRCWSRSPRWRPAGLPAMARVARCSRDRGAVRCDCDLSRRLCLARYCAGPVAGAVPHSDDLRPAEVAAVDQGQPARQPVHHARA